MEPTSANLVLYSLKRVILTLITSTSVELSSNLRPLTQVCVFFFSMLNVILSWSDPWLCVLRGHWLSPQILRWTRPWKNRVHYVWGRRSARAMSRLIEFERGQQILKGMNQTERLVFLRAKELTSLFVKIVCWLLVCLLSNSICLPPPSSPSFTDTTEDWRETSWVCSDFDVQMKMLGGVINK